MTHSHSPGRSSGVVYILLTVLGWASAPLFLKYFTGYIDAWTANGCRYSISALFWLPYLLFHLRRKSLPPGLFRAALLPTAFNIVGQMLYGLAPYYVAPGFFGFLLRSQIIFVTLGAYFLFPSEHAVLRSAQYWLGLAIVVLGSVGTIALGPGWPHGQVALGIVYSVTSGAFFAFYGLAIRRNMHHVNPMTAFSVISLQTAAALLLFMFVFAEKHGARVLALDGRRTALLVASAFIGIGIAHVFYYAAIARLGVSISGGVILLMPFVTAVASFFIFHERLKTGQWVAGTAAVVGAAIMLRARQRLGAEPATADEPAPDRLETPLAVAAARQ
ncbi:MAG: DMT family transporter [Phycisphaerae bacterium]